MASKPIIPKEKLSAYQRWELASFEHPRAPSQPQTVNADQVQLPTAEEIQQIQQQAYQEGFAAGMRDGRAQGEAFSIHMRELLIELDRSLQRFEISLAEEILALAMDIAQHLVRTTIKADPEVVLAVVREAIESLPQLSEQPTLILNPEDAVLVRQMLGYEFQESVWRVVDDPQMSRGGCRIETGDSTIDATMESRWKRIAAALGSDVERTG